MHNNIKDLLDIFIITYNRAGQLENTLKQIFCDNSPIKDFNIKIIDNNSSDTTFSVVQEFRKLYPNLEYEKNKYNIGGNANIMKAFIQAEKEYVWVLADNDDFCWDSWNEVVDAIHNKAEAIVVSTYECPGYDIAQLYIQTTFLPGIIYKTSNLNDTVIGNMAYNISNMFPHLALSSKLINENKEFVIISKDIVICGDNRDLKTGDYSYTRGFLNSDIHPLMKNMTWLAGYANSIQMIKDKKVRNYIANHNLFFKAPLISANIFYINRKESKQSLYNLACIFCVLGTFGKLKFLFNCLMYYSLYSIIYIYSEHKNVFNKNYFEKQFRIRLFSRLKTKLFTLKVKRCV